MPEKVKSNELTPEKEIVKPKAIKKVKTFLNKVVIRKLPPNLTSEEFLEIISPIPDYSDYYFVKADWSLGAEATSRAYIEFKNQEDIFIFKDKFDEYVFVDNVRGTEYPAIVEFAPFQNLPKSRARKDKHVNSIENEQHFLNFLEMLKKSEDAENQKVEPKLEYSYQIKDDKKITSTPLLEFIAASKEEKREAKKKKIEDKKKAREEEKQKKKLQIAKNFPEPIKETKEEKEVIYDDGIMVRVVPSRLGRNDKNSRKDSKNDNKEKDTTADKERRDKKEKEREERKKLQREKEEKRKQERAKEREAKKAAKPTTEKKTDVSDSQTQANTASDETQPKNSQPKREVKRYSELRKARQEKTNNESKDNENDTTTSSKSIEKNTTQQSQSASTSNQDVTERSDEQSSKCEDKSVKTESTTNDDPRWKRIQELREKREQKKEELKNEKKLKNEKSASKNEDDAAAEKNEKDERSQRQIRNKDRPALMIYRPKRVSESTKSEAAGSSVKSSDENSESTRKREVKNDKKSSRRNSKDDRKKRMSRKNSSNSNGDEETGETKSIQSNEEKNLETTDKVVEKLQELTLDASETIKEVKSNEDVKE